jgi:hypothetical protein
MIKIFFKDVLIRVNLSICLLFFIFINASSCTSSSDKPFLDEETEENNNIVRGEVVNVTITSTLTDLTLQILELKDGRKYLLQPGQGMEIGKNYDIELEISDVKPPYYDEISEYYEELIPVENVRITAIPAPGENYKLKYPLTIPPEIIKME